MLLIVGLQAYTVVWDLGDVGIGLMTIFNLIALYPMSGEAIAALRDYERRQHLTQNCPCRQLPQKSCKNPKKVVDKSPAV